MPFSVNNYVNRETGRVDHPDTIPCHNKVGPYIVRLACTPDEVEQCLNLRQRVFFRHLDDYIPPVEARDDYAHHLIVIEKSKDGQERVVGNLRLINSLYKPDDISFYSEDYYHLSPLIEKYNLTVELGRFCVDEGLRSGKILMLLWKAAIEYLKHYDMDLMFGISSFPEMDISQHLPTLTHLRDHCLLGPDQMTPALMQEAKSLHDLPTAAEGEDLSIPTLMKGYLKMGGKISDRFYEDPIFNTLFVMLAVEKKDFLKYLSAS